MKRKTSHTFGKKLFNSFAAFLVLLSVLPFPALNAAAEELPSIDLRLMETTDIHAHIMDYDYYSDKETASYGLARTAVLIDEYRKSAKNSILVDNGDLIQGNPLGEYVYKNLGADIAAGTKTNPIFDAMNTLQYDAGTLGNHEFNYGLDYLNGSLKGTNFPVVSANVFDAQTDKPYFKQYAIKEKELIDNTGNKHTVKIGYTGFVPPQINVWDKKHLEGKVVTKDIVEIAKTVIPEMKAKGADLIVVMAHTGIETASQAAGSENMVFDLAKEVPGIDAIVSGHQHGLFPGDKKYNGIAEIDNAKGTVNGIPVVMPKNWGSHLGLIDLKLGQKDGKWTVTDSQSTAAPITSVTTKDEEIVNTIKSTHESTLNYVRKAVGTTEAPINSFFALVQDDPSVQIVNDAQKWYAKKIAAENPKLQGLPILSAAAPFKAGGRNGVDYYTNIAKGDLAIKNIGDLYLYDNTVQIIKLNGSQVKEWLEMSAGQFNQIDPAKTGEQALLDANFRSYNFDVIDGVTYQIDVTKPAKYSADGKVINADSSRIVNFQYEGKEVNPEQEFLIVTNNYRASGGGGFPNMKPENIAYISADENRQALMNYITEEQTINPSADGNWSIAPIKGEAEVVFESTPAARDFAEKTKNIRYAGEAADGFAKYSLDLKGGEVTPPADSWKLTVMHTNDTHAHLDNAARRAAKVKEIRAKEENSILLDAGDVFSGDLYFTRWNGLADVEFMNMMQYDAMTFGNHEFDKGPEVLRAFIEKAKFPIVSSNVDVANESKLSDLVKDPKDFPSKKDGVIYPYVILDVNGEKVALYGLTTEDTPEASSPGENIVFNDAIKASEATIKTITETEKVDKIIALTHLGYEKDLELAEKVEGIDVIIGGHTHTLVDTLKVVDQDETPTIVAQVQDYGKFLGKLDVAFNKDGLVVPAESSTELIAIDETIAEDPEAKALLDGYKEEINSFKDKVVGHTKVALDGKRENVRSKETNLGNLIADGMLAKAKEAKGAQLAITNGGGIRESINEGDITLGEVLTVMPFGNTLFVLDITGEQIIEALEHGVSAAEEGKGQFPQVAGVKFSFSKGLPAGERIMDVQVENEDGTFSAIELEKSYRIATNGFMGAGGDGYDVFKEASYAEDLFFVDYEVFLEQLEAKKSVQPEIEGRIMEYFTPSVDVQDNKATITFDDTFIPYVEHTNEVLIDLFGTSEFDAVELKFTSSQIAALKAKDSSLSFNNEAVGLDIPLSNLEEKETSISFAKTEEIDDALTDTYDFLLTQDGQALTKFKEEVAIAFFVEEAENPRVYYVDREKEKLTELDGAYEDGAVYGSTSHFSEFTVLESDDKSNPGNGSGNGNNPGSGSSPGQGNTPDKGNHNGGGNGLPHTATSSFNIILTGLVILLAGSIFYFIQRRRLGNT
ncbi:bifunctional 2',3'-cyclic-nucleotide 2'-phosphodiesterase/3'-nucleotidase [Metabacillus dongyingensis]|uniref:bifunctional 2',3'-cyclic-nucleotide 2'-phosphodiesterase/3'-nucleotidase n=1 Tax=Metabacillus dongyingensis TaxID=2874282 RepID=UPI001CBE0355|nr:bifunctional 2',3'-cyclic-nucleotide 2'-phosphodiesterase/3'-nucleotidase [Metabacillus dongyingensis]